MDNEEELRNPYIPKSGPDPYLLARKKEVAKMKTELNIWTRRVSPKKKELRAYMWDRLPNITQYRIPREVADRVDIDLSAKIIYGLLSNFTAGIRMKQSEIAGMCGLTMNAVAQGVCDLKAAGLLKSKAIFYRSKTGAIRQAPMWYRVVCPPKRSIRSEAPSWAKSDISDLQEILDAYFNDVESQ